MLELKHISKKFDQHMILDDISFQFPDTGFIGIKGESGCGKSTLLYIIGMLDENYDGEVFYNGELIIDRQDFIQQHISFMMQNKDIISSMTVKENILLASQVGYKKYHFFQLKKVTKQLGIFDLLNQYPSQLSGGQLKRVSIAKALMKESSIIICDEPTGALHEAQAHEVMKMLKQISHDRLVIIVSHDPILLQQYCDSVLTLKNQKLKGHIQQGEELTMEQYNQKCYHSLMIYPLRQLLFQRNKLMFLFLFQWILIISFFLMVTAMNGIEDAIEKSELHSVNRSIMTVEDKERLPFDSLPYYKNMNIQYHYSLDQLQILSNQNFITAQMSFLPQNTKHIILQSGRLPIQNNEVIVTSCLYETLNDKKLKIQFEGFQKELEIVGVISPLLFQNNEIYCSPLLQEQLIFLKDNYSLLVEAQDNQMKEVYDLLSQKYHVYSDVLERTESYQSILSLAKIVAFIFIGVSFIISLILIGIVESILYFERKHDIAYLLSLGLSQPRLLGISLLESMILGIVMSAGGCLLSSVIYWFVNHVYKIQTVFYFRLQLHTILVSRYDLFVLIAFIYIVMVVVGTLLPICQMMEINMIDILREE